MSTRTHAGSIGPSDEDRFNLATYATIVSEGLEEDAWNI